MTGLFLLIIHIPAYAAAKYNLESGDVVLTNCRNIYTKGVIKAKVDDGYTVHFPKNSGPINVHHFVGMLSLLYRFNQLANIDFSILVG
jgi:hypothetical protein